MPLPHDRSIGFLRGRSVRELLLIGLGAYFGVRELASGDPDWANVAVYFGATLAFALRWFPARAIGVATAATAIAQRWSFLRASGTHLAEQDWTAYAPFAALALLCSRDLEERFDFAPTRLRFLPNLWGGLPRRDARILRFCAYALAIAAGLLFKRLQLAGQWGGPDWPQQALVVALYGAIALLAFGRASTLLAIPPLAGLTAGMLAREVGRCELQLSGGEFGVHAMPEYVLPALVACVIAGALALPYSVRLLRTALAD
jgi:hypothetical protein